MPSASLMTLALLAASCPPGVATPNIAVPPIRSSTTPGFASTTNPQGGLCCDAAGFEPGGLPPAFGHLAVAGESGQGASRQLMREGARCDRLVELLHQSGHSSRYTIAHRGPKLPSYSERGRWPSSDRHGFRAETYPDRPTSSQWIDLDYESNSSPSGALECAQGWRVRMPYAGRRPARILFVSCPATTTRLACWQPGDRACPKADDLHKLRLPVAEGPEVAL